MCSSAWRFKTIFHIGLGTQNGLFETRTVHRVSIPGTKQVQRPGGGTRGLRLLGFHVPDL